VGHVLKPRIPNSIMYVGFRCAAGSTSFIRCATSLRRYSSRPASLYVQYTCSANASTTSPMFAAIHCIHT
jgi:hypothetical protein